MFQKSIENIKCNNWCMKSRTFFLVQTEIGNNRYQCRTLTLNSCFFLSPGVGLFQISLCKSFYFSWTSNSQSENQIKVLLATRKINAGERIPEPNLKVVFRQPTERMTKKSRKKNKLSWKVKLGVFYKLLLDFLSCEKKLKLNDRKRFIAIFTC